MDIAMIAVGAGLALWGSRLKDEVGSRSGVGLALLAAGSLILVIGLAVFAVAFANGFSQGLQQSG